jgi:ATP-dependent Clp protease adaptor protein ClpS
MSVIETDIQEETKINITEPRKWKVIFLNDDSTPMDFVTRLLMEFFNHSEEKALAIMLEVHTEGSSVVGVYSFEIAESKSVEATKISRNNGFPLQIKIEQE